MITMRYSISVACRPEETLHWVRTEEYLIDDSKDVIVESSDANECNQLCQNNKLGEENFPCKAFAFSNSKQECHLTAESSYVGHSESEGSGKVKCSDFQRETGSSTWHR